MKQRKSVLVVTSLCLVLIAGCAKKKPAPVPAAPPPPPPAPTASLSANPSNVDKGASVQLSWQTQNATDVSIDGIGAVQPNGSQTVKPADSTTYHLTAKGPGGTQEATARVTVSEPPPQEEQQPSQTDAQWLASAVKDIYFDYDSHDLRGDQQQTIAADAQALNSKPNLKVTIEGHCDDRGSTEYNLTLGDERANAVKSALVQAGVNASRLNTISYGKEKPFCTESTEACWQQNRRGHFTLR